MNNGPCHLQYNLYRTACGLHYYTHTFKHSQKRKWTTCERCKRTKIFKGEERCMSDFGSKTRKAKASNRKKDGTIMRQGPELLRKGDWVAVKSDSIRKQGLIIERDKFYVTIRSSRDGNGGTVLRRKGMKILDHKRRETIKEWWKYI